MTHTESIQPYYDLISSLPYALGNSLILMAGNCMGHPMGYLNEAEGWTEDLRKHGEALVAWGEAAREGDEMKKDPKEVKESLHWVADNIELLWD